MIKWRRRATQLGRFTLRHNGRRTKPGLMHTVERYSHKVNIEKISICLNRDREESVGNDDVSIVCASKYEMVRMT